MTKQTNTNDYDDDVLWGESLREIKTYTSVGPLLNYDKRDPRIWQKRPTYDKRDPHK